MKEETKGAPLSVEALAEIKARLAAATPGPWYSDSAPYMGLRFGVFFSGGCIADCEEHEPEADRRNSIFIAAAPESMARLLGEVERLQLKNYGHAISELRKLILNPPDGASALSEVTKLRGALEQVIHQTFALPNGLTSDAGSIREIARAALGERSTSEEEGEGS